MTTRSRWCWSSIPRIDRAAADSPGGSGCDWAAWPAWDSGRPRALRRHRAPPAELRPGFGRAKSVILLYASGGQSQIDTWDPKPDAPAEIRGDFQPIETSVPGVRLCEHMPRLARATDQYTIVRSVTHDDLDHGSATYLALTGQFHPRKSSNPPPQPTDYPTYGAILKRVRPAANVSRTRRSTSTARR